MCHIIKNSSFAMVFGCRTTIAIFFVCRAHRRRRLPGTAGPPPSAAAPARQIVVFPRDRFRPSLLLWQSQKRIYSLFSEYKTSMLVHTRHSVFVLFYGIYIFPDI